VAMTWGRLVIQDGVILGTSLPSRWRLGTGPSAYKAQSSMFGFALHRLISRCWVASIDVTCCCIGPCHAGEVAAVAPKWTRAWLNTLGNFLSSILGLSSCGVEARSVYGIAVLEPPHGRGWRHASFAHDCANIIYEVPSIVGAATPPRQQSTPPLGSARRLITRAAYKAARSTPGCSTCSNAQRQKHFRVSSGSGCAPLRLAGHLKLGELMRSGGGQRACDLRRHCAAVARACFRRARGPGSVTPMPGGAKSSVRREPACSLELLAVAKRSIASPRPMDGV